jgi:uncharacterized protein
MKTIDVVVAILLVIGGLNWGLVGLFDFDIVATLLGHGTILARIVYVLVGVSAVFQIFQWREIRDRWCSK